ncbi:MAG: class I SAM-dependent methyltransferase [Saprospiraceae bacterium]|nr:class I SAM-dependent methyltransferase [Saprospiraceae bacterium]
MFQRLLFWIRRLRYPGPARYWSARYARGGHSGSGSAGEVAAYKAAFLNRFVREHNIQTVAELGCGDGRQLALADYPSYLGFDIAPEAVELCRQRFSGNPARHFAVYDPADFEPARHRAELALSLEVIFHLTEQDLYERHIRDLFALASRWVVIFSADKDAATPFPHFVLRRFTPDVGRWAPDWRLREQAPNPFPGRSVSQFFVFEKIPQSQHPQILSVLP